MAENELRDSDLEDFMNAWRNFTDKFVIELEKILSAIEDSGILSAIEEAMAEMEEREGGDDGA